MTSVTLRWVTAADGNVCPICLELGKSGIWTFPVGPGMFPTSLCHDEFGLVWDIAFGSAAHGHHHNYSCRCGLTAEWDLKDLVAKLTVLRDMLLQSTLIREPRQ